MSLIENKKAHLRFEVLETYQAGLELSGAEAKAIRQKHGKLDGARVLVRGGEAYIIGMSVPPYQVANTPAGYEPARPRKLLLKKKEIAELLEAEAKKGLTVVPLEVYSSGRYLKIRVAIVRGKNKEDKREDMKKKDAQREASRLLKR
ncbi:MAG: SsrA-binding protein SsrA-binding protein [Parcubacteria group bacterium]|nr:SsrA-binding protein SsrA-binding protein [Parcubacteria group bacterium]